MWSLLTVKYYAKQSLGLAKVIHKLAGWPADSEGSGPTATAIEFIEKTLQKLNERLELQLQTSVLLSSAWAPIQWISNCGTNFTTRKRYGLWDILAMHLYSVQIVFSNHHRSLSRWLRTSTKAAYSTASRVPKCAFGLIEAVKAVNECRFGSIALQRKQPW